MPLTSLIVQIAAPKVKASEVGSYFTYGDGDFIFDMHVQFIKLHILMGKMPRSRSQVKVKIKLKGQMSATLTLAITFVIFKIETS